MKKHLPDKLPDKESRIMTTSGEPAEGTQLSWKATYRAMAAESEDWSDLDDTVADGIAPEPD